MTSELSAGEITGLLREWSDGDPEALSRILPLVYEKLRKAASRQLKKEAAGNTIQTTALVHEVYIELVEGKKLTFVNRAQFFFFASRIMRHILIRQARSRLAVKRWGGQAKVTLEKREIAEGPSLNLSELLALDDALSRLEKLDPRQGRIVQLRYFAGLGEEEIAEMMGMSLRSVQRDWSTARLWLCRALGGKVER